MPVLAKNKRAIFNYELIEKYEAGLVLSGPEVKSIKAGQVSLKGSYISLRPQKNKSLPEPYLISSYVSWYKPAGDSSDYKADQPRKLLVKKAETKRLLGKKQEQGLTLIPLKLYTKHSLIKLEFALVRGKKKYDKRETIKKREVERQMRTLTKGKA